jgi:hypothetical protein
MHVPDNKLCLLWYALYCFYNAWYIVLDEYFSQKWLLLHT